MAAKDNSDLVLNVLKNISKRPKTPVGDNKNPSLPSDLRHYYPDFYKTGKDGKKACTTQYLHPCTAVEKSFQREKIDVSEEEIPVEKEKEESLGDKGEKKEIPEDSKPLSSPLFDNGPQEFGKKIHNQLAKQVPLDKEERTGLPGKILNKIEDKFKCKFLKAKFSIWGYGVTKSKADFWSGILNAIAFRRSPTDAGVLEVFVVDWNSTSKEEVARDWWDNDSYFKVPLYKCLIYRQLLEMHFNDNNIPDHEVRVGIMLVPFHQSNPGLLMPGLCTNFDEMEGAGLLEGLKKYTWFLKDLRHTIEMPCKLFHVTKVNKHVDKNRILKKATPLRDIISDNATIEDLCKEFGLLKLRVVQPPPTALKGTHETPTSNSACSTNPRATGQGARRKIPF